MCIMVSEIFLSIPLAITTNTMTRRLLSPVYILSVFLSGDAGPHHVAQDSLELAINSRWSSYLSSQVPRLQICASLAESSHFKGTTYYPTRSDFFCDRNLLCGVGWPQTCGPPSRPTGQKGLTFWSHGSSPMRTEITGKPHSPGFSAMLDG